MKMNLIQPHRVENMKVELFQNVFLEMKKVSVTYPCLQAFEIVISDFWTVSEKISRLFLNI